MKQLKIEQMENIEGGSGGCLVSILAGALYAGAVTGPVGLVGGALIAGLGCYFS